MENAHVEDFYGFDNEALRYACEVGMPEVAMKLLDQQEVRDHLDSNNDKMREYLEKWKSDCAIGRNEERVTSQLKQGIKEVKADTPVYNKNTKRGFEG